MRQPGESPTMTPALEDGLDEETNSQPTGALAPDPEHASDHESYEEPWEEVKEE
jgi:hypothetical protein